MSDSMAYFSGLFQKEGLTIKTSTEERELIQTSVEDAIAREFEVGTAECVIRPDVLLVLAIDGVPYPSRFEDVWLRIRMVGRECGLVSAGVYRVRPVEGTTSRKKSGP